MVIEYKFAINNDTLLEKKSRLRITTLYLNAAMERKKDAAAKPPKSPAIYPHMAP
jgi:hypothetical protein